MLRCTGIWNRCIFLVGLQPFLITDVFFVLTSGNVSCLKVCLPDFSHTHRYLYTCIHAHRCVHRCTQVHADTPMHRGTPRHTPMHQCTHTQVHSQMHIRAHRGTPTGAHVHTECMHMHKCTVTQVHSHAHTCTHMHTHAHGTHVHTQVHTGNTCTHTHRLSCLPPSRIQPVCVRPHICRVSRKHHMVLFYPTDDVYLMEFSACSRPAHLLTDFS